MNTIKPTNGQLAVLARDDFPLLLQNLQKKGYRTVGPTVHDGAIVYDELKSVDDLPVGVTDEHAGGSYRLKKQKNATLFNYVVGPQSWKQFLHLAKLKLWQAERNGSGFKIVQEENEPEKLAFIGVRACEISAIAIQDKIFMKGDYVDPHYAARRENIFIVAVNCTQPGGTCFCTSMNTGPKAEFGFDLAITEVIKKKEHYFLVDVGSSAGARVLDEIPHQTATAEQRTTAEKLLDQAVQKMGRTMDTTDIKGLLYRNRENREWEKVAARCLNCANCTMVCPTCFCTTIEDVTDLTGEHAERWRTWDSCFTQDYSYVHGGSVRNTSMARYRQWLTHKLASWIDQFGASGCVGCGRCITWCPVGIDITEEVKTIRENDLKA